MQTQTKVYPVLFAAVGIISFASILIKLADAPALIIAAYRLGIAGLLLTPFALSRKRGQLRALSSRDLGLSLLSGAFLSLHFLAWISSLQYTSVASSVVLVATNPIFVGLGSVWILKERLHPLLVWGILLSVAGGALIGSEDLRLGGMALYGDLLALLGAITHSGYLLVGQRVRRKTDTLTYIWLVYGMAALILLAAVLGTRVPLTGYSAWTVLMIVLLALGPQLIGHTSYNWALRYVSAATVAVVILGEPVGATLLAYWILGEGITPQKVLGGALVLAGIYLAVRAEGRVSALKGPPDLPG
jgi:drug/metabolite transporter (DMT)-like permease